MKPLSIGATVKKMGPLLGLVVLSAVLSAATPNFLTSNNLFSVLRQVTYSGLLAFGMTFVILIGGIDLSVGAILALVGIITASLIQTGMDPILASCIGILLGAACGAVNGLLVSVGRIAPFIATLATMILFRGIAQEYSQSKPITINVDGFFNDIGSGYLFNTVPTPVVLMLAVYFVLWFVLKKTRFGRHVYALGGSEDVARISGLKVRSLKLWVYTLSGMLSAVAALVVTSRLSSASPNAGVMYELDAIAAVVLGGTSLSGGRGWLFGTLVGVVLLGVLSNGLNLLNVSANYQLIIKGAVILFAVLLDRKNA
ncbi:MULTISPECIES: ABC transporter permease [Neisseria]|uniref:Ribose transport system permease protein rbsC n=2 Tax=Neisseria TaxID=482 RepID=A0A1X3CU09_9NEIS|nr:MULTISPECIES: ribose ABC transporter permease [Neisseria]KPN73110.1 ribose ABC transporter permease [Neisseria sp. 74A18]OSI11073.1 ribose ABC transporter permease [Neisseria canis]OSI14694.1 ribose ABC transporter permease [Neisseria dumasiana]OSI20802.1 ribose ABC transporter permease [Neisseria dumasiana]OSI32808.1 ribose ABC transporter permease [Neisseria dumasiana]